MKLEDMLWFSFTAFPIPVRANNNYNIDAGIYTLQISDGWYSIKTLVAKQGNENDRLLFSLVHSHKIGVGQKLHLSNLMILPSKESNPQTVSSTNFTLQKSGSKVLQISYNSCCRAERYAKLGLQPSPFFLRSLNSVRKEGNRISMLDLIIIRKYPVYYRGPKGAFSSASFATMQDDLQSKITEIYEQRDETESRENCDSRQDMQNQVEEIKKGFGIEQLTPCFYLKVADFYKVAGEDSKFVNGSNMHAYVNFFNAGQLHEELQEGCRYRFMNLSPYMMGESNAIIQLEFSRKNNSSYVPVAIHDQAIKERCVGRVEKPLQLQDAFFKLMRIQAGVPMKGLKEKSGKRDKSIFSLSSSSSSCSSIPPSRQSFQDILTNEEGERLSLYPGVLNDVLLGGLSVRGLVLQRKTLIKTDSGMSRIVLLLSDLSFADIIVHEQHFYTTKCFPKERSVVLLNDLSYKSLAVLTQDKQGATTTLLKERDIVRYIQEYSEASGKDKQATALSNDL